MIILFIKKSKSISIASASILAKTFRDKLICNYEKEFWNMIYAQTKDGSKNILKL